MAGTGTSKDRGRRRNGCPAGPPDDCQPGSPANGSRRFGSKSEVASAAAANWRPLWGRVKTPGSTIERILHYTATGPSIIVPFLQGSKRSQDRAHVALSRQDPIPSPWLCSALHMLRLLEQPRRTHDCDGSMPSGRNAWAAFSFPAQMPEWADLTLPGARFASDPHMSYNSHKDGQREEPAAWVRLDGRGLRPAQPTTIGVLEGVGVPRAALPGGLRC